MENSTIRHRTLLYWSIIEEAASKQYSAKKLKAFRFQTDLEVRLHEKPGFAEQSILFYVFLNEFKSAISTSERIGIAPISSIQKVAFSRNRLSFMLRIGAICLIAESRLKTFLLDLKELNAPGVDDVLLAIKIAKDFGNLFSSQIMFNRDPSYFLHDTFGAVEHITTSSAYKKASLMYHDIFSVFQRIQESGFFETFFALSSSIENELRISSGISEENEQYILFSDGMLWVDNHGESSAFSIIFSSSGVQASILKNILFLESARIYYRFSEQKINNLRKVFFGSIFQEFIRRRASFGDLHFRVASQSAAGAEENRIMNFFAASFDLYYMDRYRHKIAEIVRDELEEISSGNALMDSEQSTRLYSIAFVNIVEKISSLLSMMHGGGILPVESEHEIGSIVSELSSIIKNAYIDFAKERVLDVV